MTSGQIGVKMRTPTLLNVPHKGANLAETCAEVEKAVEAEEARRVSGRRAEMGLVVLSCVEIIASGMGQEVENSRDEALHEKFHRGIFLIIQR